MPVLKEYVFKIEETCGEERQIVVALRYEKKEEAIEKILKKAIVESSLSGML